MKKRLNVKLVVWLVVASIVLGVSVQVLHTIQVKRTAGSLLVQAREARAEAKKAVEAGETKQAVSLNKKARDFYRKYVGYRPEDHEAMAALALTWADLAEAPGAERRHVLAAYRAMEKTLRQTPDQAEVRRRLAEFVMKLGRFHDAKEHIAYLEESSPDDAELGLMMGRCHVALNENDEAVQVLRETIEKDPHLIDAYRLLSSVLSERLEDEKGAEEVLDQMVANNQQTYKSYFVRSTYRLRKQRLEEARQDSDRALALAPDEAEVILLAAEVAIRETLVDEARSQLERGLKLFPQDDRFYQALARLEQRQENAAQSIVYLQQGLKAIPESGALAWYLMDLQLSTGDKQGAAETLKKLESLPSFSREMVKLMESRLRMVQADWPAARDELEEIRPLLARSVKVSTQVELLLSDCYRALHQPDLEREALRRALLLDPGNQRAERRLVQLNIRQGQPGAIEEFESLVRNNPRLQLQAFSLRIRQMLMQPKETRNWGRVERQLDRLSKMVEDHLDVGIIRAEVLYQKGQVQESLALIEQLKKDYPDAIAPWISQAGVVEREQDYKAALKVLDAAQEKLGDTLKLRASRISVLARVRTDAAREQMAALGGNVDGWEANKKADLWRRLGRSFYGQGDLEHAREFFTKAADQDAADIESRLALFNLASQQQDLAAMDAALERIKREDTYWNFGRAVRLVVEARKVKDASKRRALLDEAERHIAKTAKRRPDWSDLVGLDAEVHQMLVGLAKSPDQQQSELAEAMEKYERAISLGGRRLSYYQQLAALYDIQGRPRDAEELIQRMPGA